MGQYAGHANTAFAPSNIQSRAAWPEAYVVGATRSGTSALYRIFRDHPGVAVAKGKELWCLNVDDRYAIADHYYEAAFADTPASQVRVDMTPMYLAKGVLYPQRSGEPYFSEHDSAISRLARHRPDAKLILTLRNPIARARSMYLKNFYQGRTSMASSFEKHLRLDRDGLKSSTDLVYLNRYSVHISEIFKYFPENQVKILIFEEWIANPAPWFDALQRFLGLGQPLDPDALRPTNTGAKFRDWRWRDVIENPRRIWRAQVARERAGALSPAKRADLAAIFQPEVAYVERLLGREIPAWRETSA